MNEAAQQNLRAFLLGRLEDNVADELSLSLLEDVELFEEAEQLEAELADAFVRNELSDTEHSAFESRLAASERLRERTAFARSLVGHLQARHQDAPAAKGTRRLFLSSIRKSYSLPIAAAVLVALALLLWWTIHHRETAGPQDPGVLQAHEGSPQNPHGQSTQGSGPATDPTVESIASTLPNLSWTLSLATMGNESVPKISFDRQAYGALALVLDLNLEPPSRQVSVRLSRGNRELLRRAVRTSVRNGNAVVNLDVPSEWITAPESRFVAEVTDSSGGEDKLLGFYEFRVESTPS